MRVIAVDVGTASVRLAVVAFEGNQNQEARVLASHKADISFRQNGEKFEQNSDEVWQAICNCSQECLKKSGIDSVDSIAFSATCSLVITKPGLANETDNIIMWMDHRAIDEAQEISKSTSKVLYQFGGVCSPEFSLAKLIWLRRNNPELFASAEGFFELPDWLVHKCIGRDSSSSPRSLCCLVCKWGFDIDESSHCQEILSLGDDMINKLGNSNLGPGTISGYLCREAAVQLGLFNESDPNVPQVTVGTSLIDAHSGVLAMLAVPLKDYQIESKLDSIVCSLAGTSSCHMLLSKQRNFTRGIWGPYTDVIIEGYHLLEAGQSLTGRLIELSVESHIEGKKRLEAGDTMYDIIRDLNQQLRDVKSGNELHILPTFHGNRSPLANPRLKGGIYGLSYDGPKSLLQHYSATVDSLIYEMKLIIETLDTELETIIVSGGLMSNEYYMQTLADVLKCKVVKMSLENVDFMVMGSALVARHACLEGRSNHPGSSKPLTKESIDGLKFDQLEVKVYNHRPTMNAFHDRKYRCYREFVNFSLRVDEIMHLPDRS